MVQLGLGDFEILTDFLSEKLVDFPMAGNRRGLTGSAVHIDTMASALTKKLNAVAFKMADQLDPLHEIEASGSRITVLFTSASSASARLDSKMS